MSDYPTDGARFLAETGKTRFSAIIEEVPEEDQNIVTLEANRYLHMAGGMRPSDAARAMVNLYKRDPAGFREAFTRSRSK